MGGICKRNNPLTNNSYTSNCMIIEKVYYIYNILCLFFREEKEELVLLYQPICILVKYVQGTYKKSKIEDGSHVTTVPSTTLKLAVTWSRQFVRVNVFTKKIMAREGHSRFSNPIHLQTGWSIFMTQYACAVIIIMLRVIHLLHCQSNIRDCLKLWAK